MVQAVYLHLPAPTLEIIGWEADAAISGSVTLSLPVPVLATGDLEGVRLSLPLPTLAIAGYAGVGTNAYNPALIVPKPTLAIAGTPGVIGHVAMTLPMVGIQVLDPDATVLALPKPVLAATALTGNVGAVKFTPPSMALSIVGAVPFVATTSLTIRPSLAVSGATGIAGSVGMTLKALALAASGHTGNIGNVNMVLPVMKLSAAGVEVCVGSVNLTFPMLLLQATGTTATSGASSAIVMHLEGKALSTYENYGFNSLTSFNGVYLGASASGIFALAGATDAGVAIDAVLRVGTTDFGTAKLKRIERAYVGYRADGEMELRVITDDDTTRRYRMKSTGKAGIHGNHVRIGKGVEARYWQFEIANVNGADFQLNCLEVKPTRMGRRVGNDEA